jgi:hypothetical protein
MNLYAYVGNNPLNATDPSGAISNPLSTISCYIGFCPAGPAGAQQEELRQAAIAEQSGQSDPYDSIGQMSRTEAYGYAAINTSIAVTAEVYVDNLIIELATAGIGEAALVLNIARRARGIRATNRSGVEGITNQNGGTVYVSNGPIRQSDFSSIVDDAVAHGREVNILSGVHGQTNGAMPRDVRLLLEDVDRWGSTPGVNVVDVSRMTQRQLDEVVNSSDDTIAAFCHSRDCVNIR